MDAIARALYAVGGGGSPKCVSETTGLGGNLNGFRAEFFSLLSVALLLARVLFDWARAHRELTAHGPRRFRTPAGGASVAGATGRRSRE